MIITQGLYAQSTITTELIDGFENGFEEKWIYAGMHETDKINHAVTTLEAKSGLKSMYFKAWQKPASSTKNIYRTEMTARQGGAFYANNEYCIQYHFINCPSSLLLPPASNHPHRHKLHTRPPPRHLNQI